ncbi:MAG: hypothetical protein IJX28_05150 [Clostridia bacterium]|nr:hypothetical protein [Clostridia bacterium]
METQQNQREKALEEARLRSKKMKKRILLTLGSLLAVLVILIVAVALLDGRGSDPQVPPQYSNEDFYPTYQGDILLYEDYLEMDRTVSYCSDPSGYGITSSISDDNRKDFNKQVLFLYDFIQILIAGDEDAYNACFNENYYKTNQRQAAFTPQMIYRTTITYLSESEDGRDKLYVYRLEYMIFENDGTYRRDIASDASRPQTITLRVTEDGRISIEKLVTLVINHSAS